MCRIEQRAARIRLSAILLTLAGLPGWGSVLAAGPVPVPGCDGLERLARHLDAGERVPINRWATVSARSTGLTLAAAVSAREFQDQFGAGVLDWSRDDLTRVSAALGECMKSASRAKRFDAQKQLIELRRVLQFHFNQPGNAVRQAREVVAANLDALEALPADADQLALVGLLARMSELNSEQIVTDVRQPIERMRRAGATPARLVAASLTSLPQAEADQALARLAATRDLLAERVFEALRARLGDAPGTVAGLAETEAVRTEAQAVLAPYVSAARLETLTTELEQARGRVWGALEQAVNRVPDNAAGGAELAAMLQGPEFATLGVPDRQRLTDLVGARRDRVAAAAVQVPIERLATFPEDLDGLRDFVRFARQTRSDLGGQPVNARQAFENAYAEAHARRIAALQGEFERRLDAVPRSREGVEQINALLKDIDAPARSELYRAGLERARAIAADVQREERAAQCAGAMPELDLDDDEAAQRVLGLAGQTPALGQLLCDIALAGNRVHGYDGPGFFDDEHEITITARDGIFRTYTLREAAVGPDQEALVGVSVADPTSEHALTVDEWRGTLASLLPDSEAARDARCARLMDTSEAELTAGDRMAAVGCVMNSLLGKP